MALRYEWAVDPGELADGMAVFVNDGTDSGTATITTDTLYCHTDITSVLGSGIGKPLAAELETQIKAVLTTNAASVSVTWTGSTGRYALTFGTDTTVDFRSATLGNDSGVNLAKWLGITATHGDATAGSGYDCAIGANSSYQNNVRPYGLILPSIQGRSEVEDEYEPEGISQDAEADDGTAYGASKDGSATWMDWVQAAETGTPPSVNPYDDGMPVFTREETAAVPWSYQTAFAHAREGWYPFLVVDGSDSEVHELRAEGTSFHPVRFGAKDYPLWSVRFRTRLRGRL